MPLYSPPARGYLPSRRAEQLPAINSMVKVVFTSGTGKAGDGKRLVGRR